MKKVLIITYYWPPSTDSKVLRWLFFTKYLKQYNWEPVVISLLPGHEAEKDDSFYREQIPEGIEEYNIPPVYKTRCFIKKMFKKTLNNNTDCHITNTIKRIVKTIGNQTFDSIITAGPPHVVHEIGKSIKLLYKINWIADFSTGWYSDIPSQGAVDLSPTEKLVQRFNNEVLPFCDLILTTSNKLSEQFAQAGFNKVETLTNGYDYIPVIKETDKKFTLVHIGTMTSTRNPENLWKAIAALKLVDPSFKENFRLELIGETDKSIFESLVTYKLIENLTYRDYLEPKDAISREFQSQVLLLVVDRTLDAQGIIPSKMYEYLSAYRPILGIGPVSGDAAEILQYSQAGRMFNYREFRELKNQIADWYDDFKNKELVVRSIGVNRYSRRRLTRQLVELLEKQTSELF